MHFYASLRFCASICFYVPLYTDLPSCADWLQATMNVRLYAPSYTMVHYHAYLMNFCAQMHFYAPLSRFVFMRGCRFMYSCTLPTVVHAFVCTNTLLSTVTLMVTILYTEAHAGSDTHFYVLLIASWYTNALLWTNLFLTLHMYARLRTVYWCTYIRASNFLCAWIHFSSPVYVHTYINLYIQRSALLYTDASIFFHARMYFYHIPIRLCTLAHFYASIHFCVQIYSTLYL